MNEKPPLVTIVGPTASGKSEVALELAEEFHGEIVSADSRQVYRGMDVGTNKPTPADQARVPHHLLDLADPTDTFTLAEFQRAAFSAIEDILQRGRLPFLVGGTGLYVEAVIENLQIPAIPPQPELRAELALLSLKELQERLQAADPVGFETIDQHNPRRLARAIEVSETAGRPFSELKKGGPSRFDTFLVGINRPSAELRQRIQAQVKWRHRHGLVEEVQKLHAAGVSYEQLESFGLEYRRVAEFLKGEIESPDELLEICQQDLWGFAKRQLTWFKKYPGIRWAADEDEAEATVSDWLMERLQRAAR